jgi:hypothetical protein
MGERTAEQWGRLAKSLPGFRWMPGMRPTQLGDYGHKEGGVAIEDGAAMYHDGAEWQMENICRVEWPDPDDAGTSGCLLALLGRPLFNVELRGPAWWVALALLDHPDSDEDGLVETRGTSLGRACIAAAATLGRWPGGAS